MSCALVAGLLAGIGGQSAHALPAVPDTDDSLSNKGVTVWATSSGPVTANQILPAPYGTYQITCTSVSFEFVIPTTGLEASLVPSPQPFNFSGCTDNTGAGGSEAIQTFGAWKIVFLDKAGEAEFAKEPNSGDRVEIVIPKKSAIFTSTLTPGCSVVLNATTTSQITAAYNDEGTGTFAAGQSPGTETANPNSCFPGMWSITLDSFSMVFSTPFHDKS